MSEEGAVLTYGEKVFQGAVQLSELEHDIETKRVAWLDVFKEQGMIFARQIGLYSDGDYVFQSGFFNARYPVRFRAICREPSATKRGDKYRVSFQAMMIPARNGVEYPKDEAGNIDTRAQPVAKPGRGKGETRSYTIPTDFAVKRNGAWESDRTERHVNQALFSEEEQERLIARFATIHFPKMMKELFEKYHVAPPIMLVEPAVPLGREKSGIAQHQWYCLIVSV